jgi:hypothetical protein
MIGFTGTLFAVSLNHTQIYSANAYLHTFEFSVANTLGLSVSTSRLNTETITSNHYEAFLLFRLQALCAGLS